MQNTFVILYQKLLDGETFDYPRAFLYRTANNFLLKALKEKQRRQTENISLEEYHDLLAVRAAAPDDALAYEELEAALLSLLSREEQTLFRLRFLEGEDIAVIAATLGISPAAAAKRLSRIRQRLRLYLDSEERREHE